MLDGFDPKQKFWTDSNSLQMMERNFNKRRDPRFLVEDTAANISANYYPVDSAIAMRDQTGKNLQVTVMNDRAQGGSAGVSGKATIELMQNRRITEDDNKGVAEILNEVDSSGVGIKVTAKYWMQIFDYTKDHSLQRQEQILIDQPLEYLFAFQYDKEGKPKAPSGSLAQIQYLAEGEKENVVTYHTFPLGRNKILARFENMNDRFDNDETVQWLDMETFAKSFYQSSNPGESSSFTIQEVSITNNQLQSDLEARRVKKNWIGEDDVVRKDPKVQFIQKPQDKEGKYALEPMRIRTFVLEYKDDVQQKAPAAANLEIAE